MLLYTGCPKINGHTDVKYSIKFSVSFTLPAHIIYPQAGVQLLWMSSDSTDHKPLIANPKAKQKLRLGLGGFIFTLKL